MKQILILSGKGGTGKTTVASAFIKLSKAKAYADCDVDAPNLHLVNPRTDKASVKEYFGLEKAEIDCNVCIGCGICEETCRFKAVKHDSRGYYIDDFSCEGCSVCDMVCPVDAVSMKKSSAGELKLFAETSVFSTAKLKMGSGTSGKLVSEVKSNLTENAKDAPFAIVDGSPGIGCPVIASVSGADIVVVVAEPSLSGLNDMERILKTARIFGVPCAVCINKADLNAEIADKIENFCKTENLPFLGKIPYDETAVKAVNSGLSIADIDCPSGKAAKEIFLRVEIILEGI